MIAEIPACIRKPLYIFFGLLGVAIGATQVGFLAAGTDQPTWLVVSFAVYGFVSAAFGYTAQRNTFVPEEITEPPIRPNHGSLSG